MAGRRSYGTGSLIVRQDRGGREVFYGKWLIGPKRGGAAKDGLTIRQAEAELRRLITETAVTPVVGELLAIRNIGRRRLAQIRRANKQYDGRAWC
jgi:hypothetical protein